MLIRPRHLAAVAATAALLGVPAAAHATVPDVWAKWQGVPDAWVRSLDFASPGQIVAGSESSGVLSATNGVGPWANVSSNLTGGELTVHQAVAEAGQVYLADASGLFVGNGTGGAWKQLGVDPGTPIPQQLDMGGINSVLFNSPSDIVVGVAGAGEPGIWYSSDGGTHWTQATSLDGNVFYVTGGTVSPVLYAAADTGFYASSDKGRSWTLIDDGIPAGDEPLRIAVSPDNPQHLYGATSGGVYRSDNAGVSWYPASGTGPTELNGGTVRAFQLTPASFWTSGIPRFFVGTDQGVWATTDGGVTWGKMSSTEAPAGPVDMGNEIVWSLNVGFGTPGSLMAGTQGHGVFTLPLQGVAAPSSIPAPSGTLTTNSDVSAATGTWGGSKPFFYRYQWKTCTKPKSQDSSGATCTSVSGATSSDYTVRSVDAGKYLRVAISAINPVSPAYSSYVLSDSLGPVTGDPPLDVIPPNLSYPQLDNAGSAPWGETMTIATGGNWHTSANSNPQATTFRYFWYRCSESNSGCVKIAGATGSSYTTTVSDLNHDIEATVIAKIQTSSSDEKIAGYSSSVYEQTPQNTDAPRVIGPAYIGTVLQSSAGAWTGHNPTYTRQWMRCGSDGLDCEGTGVTSTTYLVGEADRGSTMRVEVTATVYDPNQNRVTTVDSAPSAVVANAPSPAGGGGGGGGAGGGGLHPVIKPLIKVKVIAKLVNPLTLLKIGRPKHLVRGATLAGPKKVTGYKIAGYQWLRSGRAIRHATHRTYKLGSADIGKRISLRLKLVAAHNKKSTYTLHSVTVPKPKPKPKRRHR